MKTVTCHGCQEQVEEELCSLIEVWTGVIEAEKKHMPFCSDCMCDINRERESKLARDIDGEDWKGNYDPDSDDEEKWKDE